MIRPTISSHDYLRDFFLLLPAGRGPAAIAPTSMSYLDWLIIFLNKANSSEISFLY